jgi:hypothetical protein
LALTKQLVTNEGDIMPVIIDAPEEVADIVYGVEMGVDKDQAAKIVSVQRGGPPDLVQLLEGDIIEISKPRKWDLYEILSNQKQELHPTMRALMDRWKFWLVEVCCAFIPAEGHSITWARFVAQLSLSRLSTQPQVYDLYPLEIYDQIEQNKSIRLGLDFKFGGEANLGSYLTEIKYTRLEPKVVAAFGEERRSPTWNFSSTPISDVRGCKALYLVVQMPQSATSLNIEFGLFAKTKVKWGLFALTKKKRLSGSEQITI